MQKQYVKPKKKRKKRKDAIKRPFEQTKVGFLIQHEAPLEFKLITDYNPFPSADFIEAISYSSDSPLFKKNKFRRALIDFRKYGFYPPKATRSSVKKELYYIKIRQKNN